MTREEYNRIKELNKKFPLKEGKEIQRVLNPADADAFEQHEEAQKQNKERLNSRSKEVEELIKETASEESRNRHYDVVDRKDLAKILNEATKRGYKFKVSRNLKEGFRYSVDLYKEVLKESYNDIKNSDLKKAYEGSWYTILGCGGDINEWKEGYQKILNDRNIGQIKEWIQFSGKDMNEEFELPENLKYPESLTCLAFSLEGLDASKLALLKIQMGDRWFDDIVENNESNKPEDMTEAVNKEFVKINAGDPEVNAKAFNNATNVGASSPATGLGEALDDNVIKLNASELCNDLIEYLTNYDYDQELTHSIADFLIKNRHWDEEAINQLFFEGNKPVIVEDLDPNSSEDMLIRKILKANNLKESDMDVYGSDAFWIKEGIRNLADIGNMYINYIASTKDDELISDFKNLLKFNEEELEEDLEKNDSKNLSWEELREIMYKHNKENNVKSQFDDPKPLKGYVTFTASSFDEDYPEESRTYEFLSSNKYFIPELGGSSLFGTSLDKKDRGVRLDWYLKDWKIEKCSVKETEEKKNLKEELKVYTSNLDTFEPSERAEKFWNEIERKNKIEDLEYSLETLYPQGISDIALDDLLVHEEDWVRDMLNLNSEDDEDIELEDEESELDLEEDEELDYNESFIQSWAEDDFENGQVLAIDDYDEFKKICEDSELEVESDEEYEDLFDLYFDKVDDAREQEELKSKELRYEEESENELEAYPIPEDEIEELDEKIGIRQKLAKFKPKLLEGYTNEEMEEFFFLCRRLNIESIEDLERFVKDHNNVKDEELLQALRNTLKEVTNAEVDDYKENPDDYEMKQLESLSEGYLKYIQTENIQGKDISNEELTNKVINNSSDDVDVVSFDDSELDDMLQK